MNYKEILNIIYFNNTMLGYLSFLGIFCLILALLYFFKKVVIARIKKFSDKTKNNIDDMLILAINSLHIPFFVIISLKLAINSLNTSELILKTIDTLFLVGVIYYIIKFIEKIIDFGADYYQKDENRSGLIDFSKKILKIILWIGALILLASNLGYNVTSLIAGLGIGGIAIALALQNILADIFSSISIYFDKPFKVGDFVSIGEFSGTIKRIGIKSTRIQALQGEEVVMANQELTMAKIQNFGQMERRRIAFIIGVIYSTGSEKLRLIPKLIKKVIDEKEGATFDRSNFKKFNDSSLDFETVYFVETSDYNEYMNIQEEVNLQIVEEFEKAKIEFAYPTQTLYLEK